MPVSLEEERSFARKYRLRNFFAIFLVSPNMWGLRCMHSPLMGDLEGLEMRPCVFKASEFKQ